MGGRRWSATGPRSSRSCCGSRRPLAEQVFEKAVAQLKEGPTYRSLLAGLFLAGIRNIKPRPVGFKHQPFEGGLTIS